MQVFAGQDIDIDSIYSAKSACTELAMLSTEKS